MRRALALAAVVALAGAPARGASSGASGDIGASATAGSGDYHRFGLFVDGDWQGQDFEPYAWGNYYVDNDVDVYGAGGGVWRDFDHGLAVKGGVGGYLGTVRGTGQNGGSVLFETGVEESRQRRAVGLDYRLTAGTIGGPLEPIRYGDVLRGKSQVRVARGQSASLPSYTYNEFAGYGRLPLGPTTLGLRVSLGLPSYDETILDEELSLRIPIAKVWRVKPAIILEQSEGTRETYGSLSAEYVF